MRYIIKETDLRREIRNVIREEIENEGWLRNAAMTGMIGVASLNPSNTQAQQSYNYKTPNNIVYKDCVTHNDSVIAKKYYDNNDYVTNHPLSEKQLSEIFPQAYADRNANPQTWKTNQSNYVGKIYGKISIVGKTAASVGKNPWQAILQKYTDANYKSKQNNNIFNLSDFDI